MFSIVIDKVADVLTLVGVSMKLETDPLRQITVSTEERKGTSLHMIITEQQLGSKVLIIKVAKKETTRGTTILKEVMTTCDNFYQGNVVVETLIYYYYTLYNKELDRRQLDFESRDLRVLPHVFFNWCLAPNRKLTAYCHIEGKYLKLIVKHNMTKISKGVYNTTLLYGVNQTDIVRTSYVVAKPSTITGIEQEFTTTVKTQQEVLNILERLLKS